MDKLLDLLLRLLNFFPRFKAVNPDEAAVVIRFGKYIKTLGNGYYLYWPVITELRVVNIKRQLIDVDMQDLLTVEGKSLTLNMSIEYAVQNPRKALLFVMNYDDNIQEIAGDAMRGVVGRTEKVHINMDDLAEEVYGYVDKDCKQYGIKIIRVLIPTVTFAKPIRLIQ